MLNQWFMGGGGGEVSWGGKEGEQVRGCVRNAGPDTHIVSRLDLQPQNEPRQEDVQERE